MRRCDDSDVQLERQSFKRKVCFYSTFTAKSWLCSFNYCHRQVI